MQKQMTKKEIEGHKTRMQARLEGLLVRRERAWLDGETTRQLDREIQFWQGKLGLL